MVLMYRTGVCNIYGEANGYLRKSSEVKVLRKCFLSYTCHQF